MGIFTSCGKKVYNMLPAIWGTHIHIITTFPCMLKVLITVKKKGIQKGHASYKFLLIYERKLVGKLIQFFLDCIP